MYKLHELKTDPWAWDLAASGDKSFEIRYNDRLFQKGDWVRLYRMDGSYYDLDTKGNKKALDRMITSVISGDKYGLKPDYVVLGLLDPMRDAVILSKAIDTFKIIMDNDPEEPIADNGMTVLDGFRKSAAEWIETVQARFQGYQQQINRLVR